VIQKTADKNQTKTALTEIKPALAEKKVEAKK